MMAILNVWQNLAKSIEFKILITKQGFEIQQYTIVFYRNHKFQKWQRIKNILKIMPSFKLSAESSRS